VKYYATEQEKFLERLLLNILPVPIARSPKTNLADKYCRSICRGDGAADIVVY
jgi:hypothetical protein